MTPLASNVDLPSFENPPVIEVVCGVQFASLAKLYIPHFGELWKRFPDYTDCSEAPTLLPTIERFDVPSSLDVQGLAEIPLPRVWFTQRDENGLIQVQRDRFLHNWRKVRPTDEYPRYGRVKKLFQEHLSTFEKFLSDLNIGTLVPRQYEMTYVNHILKGEGWEDLADLGRVFPDFLWNLRDDRFLNVPDGHNYRVNFLFPDKTSRLYATIRSAERRPDKHPLLLFELTVRGLPVDASREAMWKWFDVAREWIVRGFADLSGEEIQQKVWRRIR